MHSTRVRLYFCSTHERVVAGIELLDDGGGGLEEAGEDVSCREGAGVVGKA